MNSSTDRDLPPVTTVAELARRLAAAGIESPVAEAASLLAELAGTGRAEWYAAGREIPAALRPRLTLWLERRLTGEPLPYLTGRAYFMELELEVTPDTLIPRPETELLVEFLLQQLPPGAALLELGTGSGAIALATACARPDVRVTAVELSPAALAVAGRNRAKYQLESRVELVHGDLFSELEGRRFDFLAANLPYVSETEYAELPRSVRDFEPKPALVAPDQGLALLRRSADAAPDYLNPGAGAIWELGETQGGRFRDLLAADGRWRDLVIHRDYCDRDRLVSARLAASGSSSDSGSSSGSASAGR